MELKFTGRGAMLFPQEGNTAAYFEDGHNLFLFDCGEDVASKLIQLGRLTKETECYLFITHTHSDHIGSLGTLQQYLYWVCGKKLNIVYTEQMEHLEQVKMILDAFGLVEETYNLIHAKELDNRFDTFERIRYVSSSHGDVPLKSASIVIYSKTGNVLYTGDIADSRVILEFLKENEFNVDKIYVDTSLNKSPVHLSLEELKYVIPEELRERVYCMHINSNNLIPLIEEAGFNLVQVQPVNSIEKSDSNKIKSL